MRILFTQETDWLKRNPAQQHHLAEMLSLRGHEVRVLDFDLLWRNNGKSLYSKRQVFSDVAKIHQDARVTVIRPGFVRVPLIDYISLLFSHWAELNRQMVQFRPDAIVGWGILNSFLAADAARQAGIPFFYYWIDALDRLIPQKSLQRIGILVERSTLRKSDRVLALNDDLRDYIVGLGASPAKTQVLKAGIDSRIFDPSNSSHGMVRGHYGLGSKDIVIFFMGWLYNFSGLKEVALELAKLPDHNVKLLIVGDGDAYIELEGIRAKHGLNDRLILAGKKPYADIPSFIAAADICILPAYPWEPIMQDIVPIKMYEYLAMKKPVVATKLPGVMREFGDGNGVVYVDRPEDVVGKAIDLLASGALRELGVKARDFAERYSWDKVTDEFETLLKEIVEEKRSGLSSGRI